MGLIAKSGVVEVVIQQYPIDEYSEVLCAAVEAYDYPAVTYNFERGVNTCTDLIRRVVHQDMSQVEDKIRSQLLSRNSIEVKNGLSNVLYWGHDTHRRIQVVHVRKFREKIYDPKRQLQAFHWTVHSSHNAKSLIGEIIALPQFSVSMGSKVAMFIDSDKYPVLDSRIEEIARIESSIQAYEKWASWCHEIAQKVNSCPNSSSKDLRAVDVERAIYHLADSDKCEARLLLLGPKD